MVARQEKEEEVGELREQLKMLEQEMKGKVGPQLACHGRLAMQSQQLALDILLAVFYLRG